MPGKPPLTDAILGVDVTGLTVEQPVGTPVNEIDTTHPFYLTATMVAGGLARFLPIPYRINYYFESFGPGGEGTFNPPGPTGLLNAVPVTGATSTYNGVLTRYEVPAGFLTPDRTWKLTVTADFPAFAGRDAYFQGPVIGTSEAIP